MKRIRIYWKMALIFCAINFIVLTGTCIYLNVQFKSYEEDRIKDDLKKVLLFNKDILNNKIAGREGLASADDIVAMISKQLGARATIMDSYGNVTSDSDFSTDEVSKLENHINRAEVQEAIKKGFGQSRRLSASTEKDMLYMAVPLGINKFMGIFRLSVPLLDVERAKSKMSGAIGITILFSFLLTLIASSIMSVMISGPLHEMSKVAKRLANGDFSLKSAVYSNDETGDLAVALNNMAYEIEGKTDDISKEKAKLDAVLAGMLEGVMLIDANGNVILTNSPLRKFFLIDIDPSGKKPLAVLRNSTIQDTVDEFVAGKERAVTREIKITFPETRSVAVSGIRISMGGFMEGVAFVFHDIK